MSSHTQLEMRIVIKMSWGKNQPCRKQYFKCGPECPVMMGSLWGIGLLIINKFPIYGPVLSSFPYFSKFCCPPTLISLSALNFLNLLDIFKVNLVFFIGQFCSVKHPHHYPSRFFRYLCLGCRQPKLRVTLERHLDTRTCLPCSKAADKNLSGDFDGPLQGFSSLPVEKKKSDHGKWKLV